LIEIACQLKDNVLYPFSSEDQEKLKGYKDNQVVKAKIQGAKRPRSYIQLKLYFACCKTVAENSSEQMWNSKEKVDFNCRVACHFVNPDLVCVQKDGTVEFSYRSISFANLRHIEACNYFTQAFEVMAKKLNITKDNLLKNADT